MQKYKLLGRSVDFPFLLWQPCQYHFRTCPHTVNLGSSVGLVNLTIAGRVVNATSISLMYSPDTHMGNNPLPLVLVFAIALFYKRAIWVGSQFKRPQQDSTLKGMTFNQYR